MISMPGTLLFMTEAVPMALVDLRRLGHRVRRALRRPVPGRFQPYAHTAPDRYPWLFRFAAEQLGDGADRRLLSFGCSRGDEVVSLRRHFPSAFIKGLDISPRNIAACRKRGITRAEFAVASSTEEETEATYDAVFCLAVLCHGDLVAANPDCCAPWIAFADFERVTAGLARCLRPGGYLFLHTCNFRFADTAAFLQFEIVLEAPLGEMAPDRQYGRDNFRLAGPPCCAVGFRKRADA
jgi:SAM-dependent methyltransferase